MNSKSENQTKTGNQVSRILNFQSEQSEDSSLQSTAKRCIIAITLHGVELARKIGDGLEDSELFYPARFAHGDEEQKNIKLYEGNVKNLLAWGFNRYEGIVAVVSLGAVIRLAAPLLKSKKTDPGVVVVDEKGEFAISALAGHIGGGNQLARDVAGVIGARPVITTASDVNRTIGVDIFGRDFGWTLDPSSEKNLTPVSAMVVNEEPVFLVQESGEKNWWQPDTPLPTNISLLPSLKDLGNNRKFGQGRPIVLMITHRSLQSDEMEILEPGIIYRPRVVVVGIGCNKGTSLEEIDHFVLEVLEKLSFSVLSLCCVASIDLKKEEPGLVQFAQKYGISFLTYPAVELNKIEISEPSETVFRYTGAWGVSEPAAILASSKGELVLPKQKKGNVTISVALKKY